MISWEVRVALFQVRRNSTIARAHPVVPAVHVIADRHAQFAFGIDQMERFVEAALAVRLQ